MLFKHSEVTLRSAKNLFEKQGRALLLTILLVANAFIVKCYRGKACPLSGDGASPVQRLFTYVYVALILQAIE